MKIKIELDLAIDGELLILIDELPTELYKEIHYNKVVLYAEKYEVGNIEADIKKIMAKVDRIKEVYKTVNLPSEAVEILRGESNVKEHQAGSIQVAWTGQ